MRAGLNGGVWSVGVAATGNEMGLTSKAFEALESRKRGALLATAREKLYSAGG